MPDLPTQPPAQRHPRARTQHTAAGLGVLGQHVGRAAITLETVIRAHDRLAGAPAVTRPRRVSRQRRCSEAGALGWQGQIARATRGRDLHLNVPFPRKPPDLLMAESPPTGGLSALTGPRPPPLLRGASPALTRRPPSSILLGSDSNPCQSTLEVRSGRISAGPPAPCGASVRRARPSRTRRIANAAPDGGGSGQDVVQRRGEPLAGLLELALDVQACRAGLGPQVEEVGPARQVRIV